MTNLSITSISLFITTIVLMCISIYMMISCNRRYCPDKKHISWFAFILAAASLAVNILFAIPHYEKKQAKIKYCSTVKRGTTDYYLNCASMNVLCNAYENGTIPRGYVYCQKCIKATIIQERPGHEYIELPSLNFQKCVDSIN